MIEGWPMHLMRHFSVGIVQGYRMWKGSYIRKGS
jgi:hypothetical protein